MTQGPQGTRRSGRATPMAPDERRRAIIDVVVPLLLQHGDGVTTRQIADAAGIAEGTIFRVFPDKAALLMAAAEQAMDPAAARGELTVALEGVTDLRKRVLLTAERLNARSERVMAVMMALRAVWLSSSQEHPRDRPPGPPPFVVEANRALLETLTEVFEPYRRELRIEPARAALLLRTLVLGSRHPGAGRHEMLGPEEIADALLDGIACRSGTERG